LIAPSSGGSVTNGGVLEGIGEENLGSDPAQPIDILALQETTSNGTTVQPIVNGLNVFYSTRNIAAGYAMSTYQATDSGGSNAGNGPNAMVYNTNTVQLVASVGVGTPGGSSNGEYRQVVRYLFAPAGVATNASNIFYIYVSHYKSGTSSSDMVARGKEAGIIRTNSASLPSDARVLYVGDYNVSTSTETSYQNIVSTSLIGIRGIDVSNPTGAIGINWANGSQLFVKTESATVLQYRDDFQVMSSNVYNGVTGGLAYVSGTYHPFGNNGSTPFQSSVNSGGNTSLNTDLNTNVTGISAAQLYQYLTTASDHLPVVADYTIPVPSSAPVASFTGSPVSGTAPLAVSFTDTSSGSITNWSWDFGDGGTTNLATNTVLYTYNTAGVYNVTEIVSGSGGSGTNTQANYITVLTPFQAWQIQYFGSTTNAAAAANADPDGDGQNNLAEFLAGTNPTNSASGLQITSVTTQGSDVLVTWATAGGETDVVQATAGLPDGSYSTNFLDLSPLIIIPGSGDAATNYLDISGATNGPGRYYRVRLVL
jgi:PKD repeat protein